MVTPGDVVTDGGYASLKNQKKEQEKGVVNIVLKKIAGSLKNIATSSNMETRLKKWRSGIEAVILNVNFHNHVLRSVKVSLSLLFQDIGDIPPLAGVFIEQGLSRVVINTK